MCMVCVTAGAAAIGMALGGVSAPSPNEIHSPSTATETTQSEVVTTSQGPQSGEFKAWTRGQANGTQVKFYAKYPQPGQKIQFMAQNGNGPWREIGWKRIGSSDLDASGNYRGLTNEIYFVRTFDLTPGSFNRLRVDVDGKTVWGSVRASWRPTVSETAAGVSDLDVCRVPQRADPRRWWGEVVGFTPDRKPAVPSTGLARIAVIGLDFPDAVGSGSPHDFHGGIEEYLNNWAVRHTHGKLRWEVEFPDRWLRAPKSYTEYNHVMEGHPDGVPFKRSREELIREVFEVAAKEMDLTKIHTIYIVYPEQLRYKQVGIYDPSANPVMTAQGEVRIPVFGTTSFGNPIPYNRAYYLSNVLHEVQHFQSIPLHAPGNGSPYLHPHGDYRAHTVSTWEGFVAGWHDEAQIHCFEGRKPLDVTFDMSVVDISPNSKVSAMIRVSENQIVVLESRSAQPYNSLPRGSSGLTAYVVDTNRGINNRCDQCDGLENELRQWAYYLRAEGANRRPVFIEWIGTADMNILIQPGEIARYRGITVRHISTDGVTRVRVTATGN